jgi:uncharacterized protein YukE
VSRPDFNVQPEVLDRAAGQLEHIADELARAASSFSSSTSVAHDSFGLLPTAGDAQRAYTQRAQDGLDGLHSVHRMVGTDLSQRLRDVAAHYRATDEHNRCREA